MYFLFKSESPTVQSPKEMFCIIVFRLVIRKVAYALKKKKERKISIKMHFFQDLFKYVSFFSYMGLLVISLNTIFKIKILYENHMRHGDEYKSTAFRATENVLKLLTVFSSIELNVISKKFMVKICSDGDTRTIKFY